MESNETVEVELDDRIICVNLNNLTRLQARWRGTVVRRQMSAVEDDYRQLFQQLEQGRKTYLSFRGGTLPRKPTISHLPPLNDTASSSSSGRGKNETVNTAVTMATSDAEYSDDFESCSRDTSLRSRESARDSHHGNSEVGSGIHGNGEAGSAIHGNGEAGSAIHGNEGDAASDREAASDVKEDSSSNTEQNSDTVTVPTEEEGISIGDRDRDDVTAVKTADAEVGLSDNEMNRNHSDPDGNHGDSDGNHGDSVGNHGGINSNRGNSDTPDDRRAESRKTNQTSVWDSTSVAIVTSPEQQEPSYTPILLSKQELTEQRNNVVMELLWIQQAINSRKEYLRMKTNATAS